MRVFAVAIAVILAAMAAPAAAQDRFEDRVMVNTLLGPGFVGDAAVFNVRAAAGVKVTDWLSVIGEWGALSKPNDKVISGQHTNGNVLFTSSTPIYQNLRPYATAGVGAFRTSSGILSAAERTDFATNVGAGLTYDVNRWIGVTLDYRRFFIDYEDIRGVNRYTFGLNVGLR